MGIRRLDGSEHEPVELTESAKRKLRQAKREGKIKVVTGDTVDKLKSRRRSNRSALEAANAALGKKRNNQSTDSNQ